MKSWLDERPVRARIRMNPPSETKAKTNGATSPAPGCGTAFGCTRDFLDSRFVYTVISPRARGLSAGVNMNPDKRCNFDCVYCEVNRHCGSIESRLDVPVMIAELEWMLKVVGSGGLSERPCYRGVPPELLALRHVALSGDGEPTLCPNFVEAVEAVVHLRARGRLPFFKLVLITNASGLDRLEVAEGLRLFNPRDEIWAKLDAGSQDYMNRINRPNECPLEKILANIRFIARDRPVVIQSLFPEIDGEGPPPSEVEAYVQRLKELQAGGSQISLVQIYSATRPTPHSECGHLPLSSLSHIARRVREVTGLRAEVF
jgi:wyosine [tRNA(Phe)-imidazoG37] synthetase (radical SAM superfamily)